MSNENSRAPRIEDFDPTLRVKRRPYHDRLQELQLELLRLQVRMRDEENAAAAIVFEGVDAGGKGGTIARLAGHLDPRGVRVHATGPPTSLELLGHYLQRFHSRMPRRGRIAVFDRSWYGRLLVERGSDPFKRYKLTEDDWRNRERWDDYLRAADEMFERTHTDIAPWVLVSAEQKRYARLVVLSTVVDRLREAFG